VKEEKVATEEAPEVVTEKVAPEVAPEAVTEVTAEETTEEKTEVKREKPDNKSLPSKKLIRTMISSIDSDKGRDIRCVKAFIYANFVLYV